MAGPGSDDLQVDVQAEARRENQAFIQQRLAVVAELACRDTERRQQQPEPVTKPSAPPVTVPVAEEPAAQPVIEEPEPAAPEAEVEDPVLVRRLAYVAALEQAGNTDLADLARRVLHNDASWALIEKNNDPTSEGN